MYLIFTENDKGTVTTFYFNEILLNDKSKIVSHNTNMDYLQRDRIENAEVNEWLKVILSITAFPIKQITLCEYVDCLSEGKFDQKKTQRPGVTW